ncbi:hypothetical protein C8A00DRAFT_39079, partial [Chaetomidium leptoderma]
GEAVVGEKGGEKKKQKKKKGGDGEEKKGVAVPYQVLKREKVDMLGRLLREGTMVEPEKGQAREMARLFLAALEARGKRGGRKKKTAEGEGKDKGVEELVTKMDDLSDAVLQGMVWMQWQRNLERLIQEWPELLEEMGDAKV